MRKSLTKVLPLFLLIAFSFSCQKNANDNPASAKPGLVTDFTPKELKNFVQVNLVGDDNAYQPQNIDAGLINAWGIAFPPTGPAWVSSEGKGVTPIYNFDGVAVSNAVSIPNASNPNGDIGHPNQGHPTGHVYNPTSDFKLADGNAAEFIFVSADGTISGWNGGATAFKKIDNSPNAYYTGVTLAADNGEFFLYVANFAQNRIEVFDKNWNPVNKAFADPNLPAGYSPFNIETVSDGKIFVTYVKKNINGKLEKGQGNGIINVFSPNGTLLKRFATKGKLDSPWGITRAPAGFWGEFSQLSNMILVGNYGSGQISVFDENGNYFGPLYGKGKVIEIDGLWGITFPPITGLNRYNLYFAAGPDNGTSGLVGYIKNYYIN
jgi:uncharacterized protein (TIGR03118 family)